MTHERAIILIDGSNFYFKLRDLKLHQLLTFDFTSFSHSLIGKNKLVSAIYYVEKVRTDGTEKTQELFNKQRKLLAHLKKHQYTYSLGYLLKSGGVLHEKGVDVQIAVDMLVAAYENHSDLIYLVSSDTDLIPAIKKVQEKGKTVIYVGFSHQVSKALAASCRETQTLTKDMLLPFIERQAD
jgi:6-hydroxy-3-succinoylpyridine 3-monooxygenase